MPQLEAINLAPQEAIEYFKNKGHHFGFDWQDTAAQMHAQSFTVAKAMEMNVLDDIRKSVDRAISDGITFQTFRKELEPKLVRAGWWGRQQRLDTRTGEMRMVQLGSKRRLKIIFDTNLSASYAAGRWERIQRVKDRMPFLRYVAVRDSRTRDDHAAWHGVVLPVDHPWWQTHYPPNGWRCRCTVQQYSQEMLDRFGHKPWPEDPKQWPKQVHNQRLDKTVQMPRGAREWFNNRTGDTLEIPNGIDPGFQTNPAAMPGGILADIVEKTVVPSLYGSPAAQGARMWQEIMANQPKLRAAYTERVLAWMKKTPGKGVPDSMMIGALHPTHLNEMMKLIGKGEIPVDLEPQSAAIILRRSAFDHLQRESKRVRGAALDPDDFERILDALAKPRAVIADLTPNPKERSYLYVFDPVNKSSKRAKIVVRVNMEAKARQWPKDSKKVIANWIRSAGYVNLSDLSIPRYKLIVGSLK